MFDDITIGAPGDSDRTTESSSRRDCRRLGRHTPPGIASGVAADRVAAYEATRDATDDEFADVFGVVVDAARAADGAERVVVVVRVAPERVATDRLDAGYGDPTVRPAASDRSTSMPRRTPNHSVVRFHVPAGAITLDEVREAVLDAIRPRSIHVYAGP